MSRSILKIVKGVDKIEGLGMSIKRTLGLKEMRNFTPFLLVDHFKNQASGSGFAPHPHKGHETITYVLSGQIHHSDFTGSRGVIDKGDLQFMTAGKGIVHAETPKGGLVEGLQIWVDLPVALKEVEPSYRNLIGKDTPVVRSSNLSEIRVISGESNGISNKRELAQIPIEYYHMTLGAGADFKQEVKRGHNSFIYVIHGQLEVAGKEVPEHSSVFFDEDGDFIAGKTPEGAEFVILTGQKLDQEIHMMGTFVEASRDKLKDSLKSYKNKTGGFSRLRDPSYNFS
ncbi:unnamed protein product [Kuraishia capsulata CBS 1993]|uniref:Pirin N-terminal domain-containing protein n=1 Tax=Kuraishia capsulata CBS 1993 TaxID=1382522 RepID=W6MF60_9ASCO|nr:uncharacterized protein KUCA_T00000279001 [Kuraishia capsulata CBS 1993]CDK24319.1 unnamed protein product [Kuraishia capsulata CBS 1993]